MYGYVYKFTNRVNGKVYVGKHKYDKPELDKNYLTSGVLIKKSINKYGLDNFNQEIICICESLEELNEKEIFYINHFNCMSPNGYNLTKGGDGISEPTPEILEKNRQYHLGKKYSEETQRKKSESLKKVVHTPEWIEKIRQANKGQKISEHQRELSSKRHKNTSWYNDGVNEFMLFEHEVKEGLVKGRLKNPFPNQTGKPKSKDLIDKMSKSKKGQLWYNNGEKEIMCKPENVPNGFVKGRLKKNQ